MRGSVVSLTLFCFITFLSGCSAGTPVRVQLHQIDSGRFLNIETDDTLEIVLDSNPTTGYQWEVLPWDTEIIEETDKPAYESKSDVIGSGGRITFYFKAFSPGRTSLRFIYYRSFEKNMPPAKTFEVNIVVSRSTVPYSWW